MAFYIVLYSDDPNVLSLPTTFAAAKPVARPKEKKLNISATLSTCLAIVFMPIHMPGYRH